MLDGGAQSAVRVTLIRLSGPLFCGCTALVGDGDLVFDTTAQGAGPSTGASPATGGAAAGGAGGALSGGGGSTPDCAVEEVLEFEGAAGQQLMDFEVAVSGTAPAVLVDQLQSADDKRFVSLWTPLLQTSTDYGEFLGGLSSFRGTSPGTFGNVFQVSTSAAEYRAPGVSTSIGGFNGSVTAARGAASGAGLWIAARSDGGLTPPQLKSCDAAGLNCVEVLFSAPPPNTAAISDWGWIAVAGAAMRFAYVDAASGDVVLVTESGDWESLSSLADTQLISTGVSVAAGSTAFYVAVASLDRLTILQEVDGVVTLLNEIPTEEPIGTRISSASGALGVTFETAGTGWLTLGPPGALPEPAPVGAGGIRGGVIDEASAWLARAPNGELVLERWVCGN